MFGYYFTFILLLPLRFNTRHWAIILRNEFILSGSFDFDSFPLRTLEDCKMSSLVIFVAMSSSSFTCSSFSSCSSKSCLSSFYFATMAEMGTWSSRNGGLTSSYAFTSNIWYTVSWVNVILDNLWWNYCNFSYCRRIKLSFIFILLQFLRITGLYFLHPPSKWCHYIPFLSHFDLGH